MKEITKTTTTKYDDKGNIIEKIETEKVIEREENILKTSPYQLYQPFTTPLLPPKPIEFYYDQTTAPKYYGHTLTLCKS